MNPDTVQVMVRVVVVRVISCKMLTGPGGTPVWGDNSGSRTQFDSYRQLHENKYNLRLVPAASLFSMQSCDQASIATVTANLPC